MARILPGPTSPDSRQRVRLDGREYELRWRWLGRSARWALDISSADGTLLAGGLAVQPNTALLAAARAGRPELPPGDFFVLDRRAAPSPPTLEGLGSAVSRIVYLEEADIDGAATVATSGAFEAEVVDGGGFGEGV